MNNSNDLCRLVHKGPLCDVCLEGYAKTRGLCAECPEEDKTKNWMVSITAPGCPKDPCLPNNTYPVIVCLDEIIIENPGFGFDCCKDTVKIEPANGAKAEIVECRDGQLIRIKVIDCGAGFTELPEISINTETGFNAILKKEFIKILSFVFLDS